MKVVIAGGTGFVGHELIGQLVEAKHEVTVLTRDPSKASLVQQPVRHERWDGETVGPWLSEIDGADAVLNYVGESIGERWSAKRRILIRDSRVNGTRAIVEAIRRSRSRPGILVSASAVGYYGPVEKGDVTESWPRGEGFLADVCGQWEQEAYNAESLGVRVVTTRTGVVLGSGGGALPRMLLPFKLLAGGPIGTGRQWFPWVHISDLAAIVLFVIKNPALKGPVNVVSPEAVTMKQFCSELGKVMHRPSWAPVPGFVLQTLLGEMSSMILTGQKVVAEKLLKAGFEFRFPKLGSALEDVLD